VITAAKAARALDRDEIGGLLDDADHVGGALAVGADRARVGLGEAVAGLTEPRLLLQRLERVGETVRQAAIAPQHVEGQARGGLLADPGELRELLDQPIHRGRVRHAVRRLSRAREY
jgi:hypothetical protein